jgi:hypothetical protein
MRKFILIAGFVLASAAAQAGDRSLSLAGSETQAAPARATDASKSAEAAEAPKYVERPAVVEPKTESKAETSKPETTRTETASPRTTRAARAARMHRPAAGPASAGPGRPMARRTAYMSGRPHGVRYRIARIIGALHRHGIYW